MSAVDKLEAMRRKAFPTGRLPLDRDISDFRTALLAGSQHLVAFAAAFKVWRESECVTQSAHTDDIETGASRNECVGDNHLIDCPVEVARQDAIATFDQLEGLQL